MSVAHTVTPVDCLPVPVRGAPQVVDDDEQGGEADKRAGHDDGPQHGLDLWRRKGRQRGRRHVRN